MKCLCVSPLQQLMISWCTVKMRCLIKLQWEQKLSIVACDKEPRCMIGMYQYLLLGRSWEFFSFNSRKLKLTSDWSAESYFKSGRKNCITVFVPAKVHIFHIMTHGIKCYTVEYMSFIALPSKWFFFFNNFFLTN